MVIDEYFASIRQVIERSPLVASFSVTYDRRSEQAGFVSGALHFDDGSVLHFREYVVIRADLLRLAYAYHYQRADQFVFRYDNTAHHRKLNLASFPHHKHTRFEDKVESSPAPTLADVLSEISQMLDLPK
jgi:hypothetical protein